MILDVQERPMLSKNVPECSKMTQLVPAGPKMTQDIPENPKMSQNDPDKNIRIVTLWHKNICIHWDQGLSEAKSITFTRAELIIFERKIFPYKVPCYKVNFGIL